MQTVVEVAGPRTITSRLGVVLVAATLALTTVCVGTTVATAAQNDSICNSVPGASIPADFMIDACFNGSSLVLDNRSALPLRANTTPYVAPPSRYSLGLINELPSQVLFDIDSDPYLLPPGTRLVIPTGTAGNTITIQRTNSDDETKYLLAQFATEFVPGPDVADQFVSVVNALSDEFHKFWDCRNRNNWIGDIGCDAQTYTEIEATLAYHSFDVVLKLFSPTAIVKFVQAVWKEFQYLLGFEQHVSGLLDLQRFNQSNKTITIAAPQASGPGGSGGAGGSQSSGAGGTPPPPTMATVTLGRGPTAPAGYRYAITIGGFPAGSAVSVSCRDSVDAGGFYTFTMHADGSGSAYTAGACYSGDGPDHWVVADGVESNHVTWTATAPVAGPPPPTTSPPPPPTTYAEQSGSYGSPTFIDVTNASGQGPTIAPMQWVQVSCKVKPASTIGSAYPDGYWYRVHTSPWSDSYYAVANTFWNGDIPGQKPYTHNTDFAVPDC